MRIIRYIKSNLFYFLLLALGLAQVFGKVFQFPSLQQLGYISAASPLPLVFTDIYGYETFASDYELEYTTVSGHKGKITKMDRKYFSALAAPHNLKGTYSIAIAYIPIFPENMIKSVLECGYCNKGRLAKAIGIEEPLQEVVLNIKTKTAGRNKQWRFVLKCDK